MTSADRQAEEARPELGPPVLEVVGGALHDRRQKVAVAVLVLAPVLELLEDGVQLLVGVVLEIAVDGDVAPVADLLREVRRVQDVLGLEEGVLAVLGKEAQVERDPEVGEGLVEEPAEERAQAQEGNSLAGNRKSALIMDRPK